MIFLSFEKLETLIDCSLARSFSIENINKELLKNNLQILRHPFIIRLRVIDSCLKAEVYIFTERLGQ